ncbi:UNVERIFIED_CONTAM: Glyoxysomal fatty acid beta-oxidation multifunctional protein MFP-a [Sesamum angustifolium]|uniref:Glyoxysomal fatty acid beta-oxidation multifunctional protein MFP-a n=1 Tax=Sesamum angustifolium TaxID=2727405 RepID=A0AAW2QSH6_9LAMI
MLGKTALEVRADGVAVVTINNPPLNLLSVDVILSLKESIEGALIRDDVKAIVITGTQRLPRLVGLSKALEMILMSKRVDGKEARSLSLVDTIAPADKLLEVACRWALDIVERRRPWVISLYRTDKLESLAEARAILKSARLEVQRQNPNVAHPLVCIDVIEQGIVSSPRKALRKIPVISKMNLLPRKIVKVAVVGGGLMSSEIATMLVLSNYQVILKETNKKHLIDAISIVKGECSGKGFYNYDNCGKVSPDPELSKYMKTARDASNVTIDSKLTKLSDSEMVEMILFPALNEACRMISDGVVIRSSDLDVASVLGMGFPAYRGGIIYWSDSFGSKYICSRLEKWSKAYGGFFQPCNYIMERSAKNISLTSETRQAKSQL